MPPEPQDFQLRTFTRGKTTLETSGEDRKLHSKRVGEDSYMTILGAGIVGGMSVHPSYAPTQLRHPRQGWKLTVVLDYYEAKETYSRIGLLRSYGNLQSY